MNSTELMENLVLSMISVNNYSLEKAYQIKEKLKQEGLYNIETLKNSPPEQCLKS